ncbi:Hypothetical predicted protein [Lecanosticta acicola]|uniref:Uncharacterized protein n=1 Tax=Lecanosticta acicola TaxID=111012 RepID=A0AAI8YU14_9PEZI|nr:Hypothetical predicted protein [Lecanosticta acicola]
MCGVHLGFPALLVWAKVGTPLYGDSIAAPKLEYMLGDSSPIAEEEVALCKAFASLASRVEAANRLQEAADQWDRIDEVSSLPIYAPHLDLDPTIYILEESIKPIIGSGIQSVANLHKITHDELQVHSVYTESRAPIEAELRVCSDLSTRLGEEYSTHDIPSG